MLLLSALDIRIAQIKYMVLLRVTISNRELHKFCILVGLEEVVHEICVQGSLNHAGYKGGPHNVLPFEYPKNRKISTSGRCRSHGRGLRIVRSGL